MNKKLVVMLCIMLVTVLAFAGCDGATPAAESSQAQPASDLEAADLKIGVVAKSFDEFQTALMQGATDKAVEMGVKEDNVITLAPKSESDVLGQVQMIENCTSQGCNIILLSAEDPNTVNNALQTAYDQGITIVSVDTDAPNFDHKVTYIGTDNENAAYEGAKEFCSEYLEEGANLIILRGKLGDTNHEARTKGMEDAIAESGCNILEIQDANCDTNKATSIMEDMLIKFDDEIDAVIVTSDSMAVGAIAAIKQAGVMDQIAVCGFDGFQVSIQCIADGTEKMIIAQKPYWIGQKGVECGINSLLNGETYEPYINPGIAIIDSTNYEDFLE